MKTRLSFRLQKLISQTRIEKLKGQNREQTEEHWVHKFWNGFFQNKAEVFFPCGSKSLRFWKKSQCDLCKLTEPFNKLISKGYINDVVIISFNIVYIGTNINFVLSKLKLN